MDQTINANISFICVKMCCNPAFLILFYPPHLLLFLLYSFFFQIHLWSILLPPCCPLARPLSLSSFNTFFPSSLSLSSAACKHRHLTIRVKFTSNMSRKKKLLKHQNLIHLLLLQQMEQVVCLNVCVCAFVYLFACAWGILSLFTNLVNSFHNAFTLVYIAVGWLSSFIQNTKTKCWHFANTWWQKEV